MIKKGNKMEVSEEFKELEEFKKEEILNAEIDQDETEVELGG